MALTEQQTAIRQTASSYANAGYTIIKLNGKIPATKNWPTAEYVWPDEIEGWFNGWAGNFGVVLGPKDLVIDIDPRNFRSGDKPHVRLLKDAQIANIKDIAPIVKTGSGGLHIYFRLPDGFSVKEDLKEYPGVEFKSVGRQVVGASCIHPDTKRPYKFVSEIPLDKLTTAPDSLLDIIRASAAKKKDKTTTKKMHSYSDDEPTIEQYIEYLMTAPIAIEGDKGDATTYQTACRGRDFGLSPEKTTELMLDFYNTRCLPPWDAEALAAKVLNAYAYASGETGNARPDTQFDRVEPDTTNGVVINYQRDQHGRLLKTVANAYMILLDPAEPLAGALCYDEFNAKVKIVKELPWVKSEDLPKDGKTWSDDDSIHLRLWFSKVKRFEVPVQNVDQAVVAIAQMTKVHPIRDYLNGLKWDGQKRLDQWLVGMAGAENNEYVHGASRKILIQAVKRVYEPGCKADYVVVLEGKQGIGKTRLVQILGGSWYADLVIDPHARDTVDAMIGKWFIEFSEMEVTRRADAQALKAFITRTQDTVRLAYGRRSMDFLRQCVFIGSINPDASCEYLTDSTGNRRFWPIAIKYVDQVKLAACRDQLFAEAVHAYKSGEESYIVDDKINELAAVEQKKRQVSDPWIISIAEWIEDKRHLPHTAKNVFVFALRGNESSLGVLQNRRIVHCLKELGSTGVVIFTPSCTT